MTLPYWISFYYVLAAFIGLYFIWKYRTSSIEILFILMAFNGAFSYYIPGGDKVMKIITTLFVIYVFMHEQLWKYIPVYRWLWLFFSVYSVWFFFDSLALHQDNVIFTFAQYSKVLIPYILLFAFIKMRDTNPILLQHFNHLIFLILLVQIGMSLLRYMLNGFHYWEGMVGTFGGIRGGGAGTGLPLIALCWVALNSNMKIKGLKAWLFLIGLLVIGVAAGKRAVILLFPILYFVLSIFVSKKKYNVWMLVSLAVIPLIFVLGVKMTPSLNPDNKVWGTFDLDYAIEYVKSYSGIDDTPKPQMQITYINKKEVYQGRIGSVKLWWKLFSDYENYNDEAWYGVGLQRIYGAEYEFYRDSDYNFGLDHRGSMTGIFMHFKALGVIGLILFLLYYVQMFFIPKYKKYGLVVLGVALFDFVFYNTTIIREPIIATLVVFCLVYADIQYTNKGEFIGKNTKFYNNSPLGIHRQYTKYKY